MASVSCTAVIHLRNFSDVEANNISKEPIFISGAAVTGNLNRVKGLSAANELIFVRTGVSIWRYRKIHKNGASGF